GVSRLHGAQHRLGGDYIEAGAWAVSAAITGGEMAIDGAREDDIEVVASVLKRMKVQCGMRDGTFEVKPSTPKAVRRITTGLWPSLPSDLISLVTVLATQAEGRTLVHDWMYELRLFALEQMSGMGADMFLADAPRTHDAARRPHARHARPAIRDVVDCSRPRRRRADPCRPARNGRTRLQPP